MVYYDYPQPVNTPPYRARDFMGVQQTTLGNTGMTGSRLLLLLWIIRVDSRSLKAKWGKGRSESERIGDATLLALKTEKGPPLLVLKMERDHQPRNVSSVWKLEKAKKWINTRLRK